jgi:thioredoxin-like negative regulator of GroEL
MMRLASTLALFLVLPVHADEKPKKPAAVPAGVSADELMKQAEQKIAAGDTEAAAELLRKAVTLAGASGEPSLRLGRLLEAKYDLDGAMDAFKDAAGKTTGATKGEALGHLAVLQEMRGSIEATATAEAAATADPAGVWPTIALSRARARPRKRRIARLRRPRPGASRATSASRAC